MTTTIIAIAILAALAVMLLVGLILWQRQSTTHLKIMKNMEQQIQTLQQELEILNRKIGEAAESSQRAGDCQAPEREAAERAEQTLEENVSTHGESLSENIEQTSEAETQQADLFEGELLELERLDAEITQSLQEVAAAEKGVLEEPQRTDLDSANAKMDELESHVWSQLVELAEQEEQEQEKQGQSADDEKLMDSDQAGEQPGPSGYNVGKSGKIYTEEELELLIKE